MKMKFKAALSLMIVVMMVALSGVSALAATYTYSTIYTKDSAGDVAVKVTATASNVTVGEQVTYYATKGGAVVYLDQEETGSTGTVNFEYITDDANGLTQKFGGTSLSTAQPVGDKTGNTVTITVATTYDAPGSEVVYLDPVEVMAQDFDETDAYAPRTFHIGSYHGPIKSMYFQAEGSETKVDIDPGACLYVGDTITVYPAVFTAKGVLYVEFETLPDTILNEAPLVRLGDIIDNSEETGIKDYIVLGRVVGYSGYYDDAGICVTFPEAISLDGVKKDDDGAYLFPATQFGSDGSFAISLQDDADTHFCYGASVRAYIRFGDEFKYSDKDSQFTESNFWTESY